ncbi:MULTISPECIES: MDR family oxidoreductase [unclassified Enterobacter]|uniref:acrylyl-CoA reductase (NADPH) n=1 Tax=unclassified Enterobacter TaxID=2608935 RepID=UPI00106F9253|nr:MULTISPECIES: MDR family oxidoreductase [unclassified Enterobacter]MBO4149343.1 oxidoreductase [Enterobacter ludwigii]HEO9145045.1 oxidoreductase [Enterobacter asburiae]MBM1022864.1 oxidoreductase [Enterobacter sp. E1]MCR1302506.1 oxidoreductase [Enterobacter sp. FL1277]MCR1307222.1 oxidoreductase [Enterobacter sp. BT1271]
MFNSLLINKKEDHYSAQFVETAESDLPDGDVTVNIDYSSINYKDALAITGRGPIVRQFPMVPGIDFAGTVSASSHPEYQVGDQVLLTGWGVGEKHWGGLSEKARVKGDWLTPLPAGANSKHVMAIGTAGFTAMLCVDALLNHGVKPEDGSVLVTGASGGVGSIAAMILASMGFQVTASTGRPQESEWLYKTVGVNEIINRTELSSPGKPLQKERWAAAIDTVGSHTLCNACAGVRYGSIVAACGMAQGMDMMGNVAPFILRGVTLKGIDSVMFPKEKRAAIWQQAITYLPESRLDSLTSVYPLSEAISVAEALLSGGIRGRAVIKCS